jgi:dCMP deaminase
VPTDFSTILKDRLSTPIERPSWAAYFMSLAVEAASRGTCTRARTGCVLMRETQVLSLGYNGAVSGQPHCVHADDIPCRVACHSEANAVAFAAKNGVALDASEAYCTLSPCKTCATLLIQSGIRKLTYLVEYRELYGLMYMIDCGIEVIQFV